MTRFWSLGASEPEVLAGEAKVTSASRSPTPHPPSRRFYPPAHPRSPSPGECPFRRWGVAPVPACVPCLTNLAPRPSEAAPPAVVWAGHCHTHGQRGSIYGALPLASPSGEPFPQRTLLSSNLPAIGQAHLMLHPSSTCLASRWVARTPTAAARGGGIKVFVQRSFEPQGGKKAPGQLPEDPEGQCPSPVLRDMDPATPGQENYHSRKRISARP